MKEFLKKKWSVKFSFLKIGLPLSILYFLVIVFTFFSNLNILIHLLFLLLFSFISYKSTENYEKFSSKLMFFLLQMIVLYIFPIFLYILILGFLLSGWDPIEFGKYN